MQLNRQDNQQTLQLNQLPGLTSLLSIPLNQLLFRATNHLDRCNQDSTTIIANIINTMFTIARVKPALRSSRPPAVLPR
jgi:hypothetical protein